MSNCNVALFKDLMDKRSLPIYDSLTDYLAKTVITDNLLRISTPSSDTSSSAPASSKEGAEFLFGLAKSRKERRKTKRKLRKNTKANCGLWKVKERLAMFEEEAEYGFCFDDGWDDGGEDEVVFSGDDNENESESEDSGCFCDGSDDGSGVVCDEEMDDEEDDDNEDEDDSDEEMEDYWRKARKSVRWKEDGELEEVFVLHQEETYVFAQQRRIWAEEEEAMQEKVMKEEVMVGELIKEVMKEEATKDENTHTIDPRFLELPQVPPKDPESVLSENTISVELEAVVERSYPLTACQKPRPAKKVSFNPLVDYCTAPIPVPGTTDEDFKKEKPSREELFHRSFMQKVSPSRLSHFEAVLARKLTLIRNTAATAHCQHKRSKNGCAGQCRKEWVKEIWCEDVDIDEVDGENEKRRKIGFSDKDNVLIIPAREISDYDHEAKKAAFKTALKNRGTPVFVPAVVNYVDEEVDISEMTEYEWQAYWHS